MSAAATAVKRTPLALFTLVALVATALVSASAAAPPDRDRQAPSTPQNLRVSAAAQDSVTLAWDASSDDDAVVGYYVLGDRRPQIVDKELGKPLYTVRGLGCGQAVQLSVVAFDGARNRSEKATAVVSSAACLDTSPPSRPTGFAQAATSEKAVVLTWTPSVDDRGVVGYGVYRNLERVATPSDPSAPLGGLSCGRSYEYFVDAFDAAGNRSPLSRAWIQTSPCPSTYTPSPSDTQAPSKPTGLAASAVAQTSVSLTWNPSTDNVGVSGYDVFRNGVKMATPSGTSVNLTGLACTTSYTLAVQARDAAGNTSQRAQLNVATAACSSTPPPPSSDTQAPSTPTGLAPSNVTQTSASLSWNASTDNIGVAGYDVFRDGVKVASPSGTSANVTGLTCATSYALAVQARDVAGNVSQRAQVNVATAACSAPVLSGDTQAPSTPGSLRVSSATGASVSLAWNTSTDNVGVAGYRTYRDGTLVSTGTQTTSTVASLVCGNAYTFEVTAFDAAGNSSPRASVIGSTLACPDTDAPSAPTNVSASSRTATSIALTWSASFDEIGVAGYGLYKSGALAGTSASTTWIYSGLTCGTNYTLAVDAYDAAGNRSPKTTVMVSTTACPDTTPPSTPTGLAASNVTQTGLTLTWNPSTDNTAVTGYDVYRNGTKMATVTSTTSNQAGLACGTTSTFGVRALDAAGNASGQAQLIGTTASCAPPPSGVTYPVSYYTGPLGQNNVLPTKPGAFLFDYYAKHPDGAVTLSEWKTGIQERESYMGRKFDGLHVHYSGGGQYQGFPNCMAPDRVQERWIDWILARGQIALVTWTPARPNSEFLNGSTDACIRAVADHFKTYAGTVMLRMFHEFDGSWTKYHACGQNFIEGWRRVVAIFQERGATNVGFWWNPTEGTDRACIDSSYPGDTYVDWIGPQIYNFCLVDDPSCFSTPWRSGWAEFSECIDYAPGANFTPQHDKWGPRKPIVIGELGTVYDPSAPTSKKGNWYRNIPTAAKNLEYLHGLSFYDVNVSAIESPKNNFHVDYPTSNPDVYAGFREMARDPWFNTRS